MNEVRLHADLEASLWRNNPMLVHLLGITPLIAVSSSAILALALGIGMMLVAFLSATTLRALQQYLSPDWRLFASAVTLAAWCTVFALLLQEFFHPLQRELGIYVLLIPCNFALLLKMDKLQRTESWDGVCSEVLILGLSVLLALVGFALLRELVTTGSVFSDWQLLLPHSGDGSAWLLGDQNSPDRDSVAFGRLPAAGLLLLGLSLALLRLTGSQDPSPLKHRSQQPVVRARVTGKLQDLQ